MDIYTYLLKKYAYFRCTFFEQCDIFKPFWIIWESFSSAHICFSVVGQSGQNHKKADLSLKMNFFQIFRSRFGFLVQFYPYPELEIKKYAQGQELLIFAVFLKNWPTVRWREGQGHGTKTLKSLYSRSIFVFTDKIVLKMASLRLVVWALRE